MIIDKEVGVVADVRYNLLNVFPDQFKTDKEKQDPTYIKNTLDYFANVAFAQFRKNKRSFVKNYNLMNGIIDRSMFDDVPAEIKTFADSLLGEQALPSYVKHYPILNPPVNKMVGELAKRPDGHKVRAFDDDSQDEELQYKTGIMQQYIMQEGKRLLLLELAMKGEDVSQISDEDIERLTMEKVQDYMTSYTTQVEKWGNHVLTALKVQFNMKEKSEECFRDLLISAHEYFHIFQDNSKTGFNIEALNPKNYWKLGTPDAKYSSAISGDQNVPYANGTVHVMEISEIMEKFPNLTKKEIDHLRKIASEEGLPGARESNLTSGRVGADSIIYDTYSPLIEQEKMLLEAELRDEPQNLDFFGLSNTHTNFGYKFTVVRSYHQSKKKVGLLTYFDTDGSTQSTLVDETYVEGTPGEISIDWGWVNQMYEGYKIGSEVYGLQPFELLEYSPIIGVTHQAKNTQAKSLVDLMLPYQILFNICMNQLWELLEKEKGRVHLMSIRHVPTPKDGDAQDAIEIWEEEAKKSGTVFVDDSPENTKGASSFNQTTALDLTRTNEIQSRYTLAAELKTACWELIGMNRERLGGSTPTQTATSANNNLVQSFDQTEPYFAAHDYVLNQTYQALLDAAQYVESHKPTSTISYITNQGEQAAMQLAGEDLRMRDLKVFVTGRAEDQQLLNEFRQLSQAMLQNGASVYDVSVLYTTNSLRQMQKIFKDLKKKQEEMFQQEQEIKQSELQQQGQIEQAKLEQTERHHQEDVAIKKYEIDVRAQTDLAREQIKTYFQASATDSDADGSPDIVEIANHALKNQEVIQKRDLETQKLSLEMNKMLNENQQKAEDRKVERENMKNDLQISNNQLKAAKAKKPKPTAKKK